MGIKDDLEQYRLESMNAVERALYALERESGREEVEEWINAVDSGLYPSAALAKTLRKHSGEPLEDRRVSEWIKKRKESA